LEWPSGGDHHVDSSLSAIVIAEMTLTQLQETKATIDAMQQRGEWWEEGGAWRGEGGEWWFGGGVSSEVIQHRRGG
jgi:hypothetical protein